MRYHSNSDKNLMGCIALVAIIVIAVILLIVRACGGLFPNYSIGDRTGVATKVSKKGFIWKSYEGSMNVGGVAADSNGQMVPVAWAFSIQDPKVAEAVNAAAEKAVRVTLHYHQYGLKPISQDSSYVVDGVRVGEQWLVKPPDVE